MQDGAIDAVLLWQLAEWRVRAPSSLAPQDEG